MASALGTLVGRIFRPVQHAREWVTRRPRVLFWLQVARLGLFQFGLGVSLAPIVGTLNRVLIDDLQIPALAVGFLIALHYFVSPIRAIVGFHSDRQRAAGRWRTPYLVLGAMLTYGGLATAPFSLIVLSLDRLPFWVAMMACTAIFLAYGIGVNIVETVYLALVSDITRPQDRGRVVAFLWMLLILGTVVSSIVVGALLTDYSHAMLVRVMQGSAVIFVVLTFVSLLGREQMRPDGTLIATQAPAAPRLGLGASLRVLWQQRALRALFAVLFIATLGFAVHDVLLEPYGGQVLQMSVAATTRLTALWGLAMIAAVVMAGWLLWRGRSPALPIVAGCTIGALGFLAITVAGQAGATWLFHVGVAGIGIGRGLFIVASISLVMALADGQHVGLFVGLWGVMQALAQGTGTIGGGFVRDLVQQQSGSVLAGYAAVYQGALLTLLGALALFFALRLWRRIADGAVRSPWDGLQNVPADQMVA
jgi:BCD family chlorophyll transporter-like MFS transporter